jgi:hypothetical protein
MLNGRSQEAYDRFSRQVDGPMTVLALLWLPVLIVPLVLTSSLGLADTLDIIDYLVWALFACEYIVKFYLAPQRRQFLRHHLLDLVVVAVPIFRPLRAARLLRLARVGTVLTDGLGRARAILTHKGLHFVLLAVVVLMAGMAALARAELRGPRPGVEHSQLRRRALVGRHRGHDGRVRGPLPGDPQRPGGGGRPHDRRDRPDRGRDRQRGQLLRPRGAVARRGPGPGFHRRSFGPHRTAPRTDRPAANDRRLISRRPISRRRRLVAELSGERRTRS